MRKSVPPANPDAYVAALSGWQRDCVTELRAIARKVRGLDEVVKWGHLVYLSNGPVCLVRAEGTRVLFGFWRGQRLQSVEPRLKGGGKYEMATVEIREGLSVAPGIASKLVRQAVALNAALGNPAVPASPKRATPPTAGSKSLRSRSIGKSPS
jgi:hypothetical protein